MNTHEKLFAFYKKHNDEVRKITNNHRQERAKLIKREKGHQAPKRKYAPSDLKFDNEWIRLYKKHIDEVEKFDSKYAYKKKLAAIMEKYVEVKDKFQNNNR